MMILMWVIQDKLASKLIPSNLKSQRPQFWVWRSRQTSKVNSAFHPSDVGKSSSGLLAAVNGQFTLTTQVDIGQW